MTTDELFEEADETVEILIREELEVHHRLEGHPIPIASCPVCRSHQSLPSRGSRSALCQPDEPGSPSPDAARPSAFTVSMVSASAGVLSGRYRRTRAKRSVTPPA